MYMLFRYLSIFVYITIMILFVSQKPSCQIYCCGLFHLVTIFICSQRRYNSKDTLSGDENFPHNFMENTIFKNTEKILDVIQFSRTIRWGKCSESNAKNCVTMKFKSLFHCDHTNRDWWKNNWWHHSRLETKLGSFVWNQHSF